MATFNLEASTVSATTLRICTHSAKINNNGLVTVHYAFGIDPVATSANNTIAPGEYARVNLGGYGMRIAVITATGNSAVNIDETGVTRVSLPNE
jgi:hypothetical protein